jgi:hypothetical protein
MKRLWFKACLLASVSLSFCGSSLLGQELEPRAYASAPVGLQAFAAAYARSSGSLLFDPTLPLKDVTADNGMNFALFSPLAF